LNKKRIALTLFLALLSEVANKLVPLITLHFVASRLGTGAFGLAQFSLWLIDWGIFFTIYGFAQVAPIMLRNAKNQTEFKEVVGSVMVTRLILAFIATAGLILAVGSNSEFGSYKFAVLSSLFILFTTAIDASWILLARQKMGLWSLLSILAKLSSLTAILFFIKSSENATMYVVITNMANGLMSVISFFIAMNLIGIAKPRASQILSALRLATPFAVSMLLLMTVERFDLYLVEKNLGENSTGIYAAASKLVGSLTPIFVTITTIFYSEMMAHHDNDSIQRHVKASIFWTVSALAPVIIGIWFVDTAALQLIFGPEYVSGNHVLSILVGGSSFYAIITIFGFQLLALKGLWRPLVLALGVGAFSGISLGLVAIERFGMVGVAWSTIIARVVAGAIITSVAVKVWSLNFKSLLGAAARAVSPAFIMGAALLLGRYWNVIREDLLTTLVSGGVLFLLSFSAINASEMRSVLTKAVQALKRRAST
jgi:O-antigen/teichoic acid export membrane protein